MFTGIVEGIGIVHRVESREACQRLHIKSPFSLNRIRLGDSIAVDGCCLTVTGRRDKIFSADVSPETLDKTTLGKFKKGTRVNLERPFRLSDRLGGHLVQGHVDGVGTIFSIKKIQSSYELYYLVKIKVPEHLKSYMVDKGSVAVDGISLTINVAKKGIISLCIIPHTQKKTTLVDKKPGDRVNLEADILLKYLDKMLKLKNL